MKAAGEPVEVEWNQGVRDVAYWGMLKDAPHPQAALAFLNFFMSRPEAHVAFSRAVRSDSSNLKALELLSPPERQERATYPENAKRLVDMSAEWVGANQARVLERWNAWLVK